jgi:methylthioribose-1-phosphate isomerase
MSSASATATTLRWENGALILLDQTALPDHEHYIECRSSREVAEAIRTMKVRGAPAIGAAGAYGVVLAALQNDTCDRETLTRSVRHAADSLLGTRPTAVNLRWALERMLTVLDRFPSSTVEDLQRRLLDEAHTIAREDVETNRAIGERGASLIAPGERILTYCNTGSLATVDYGTALGIIRTAHERGLRPFVYVCETRPFLQGARLTTWEVLRYGIAGTLIADNAAAHLMSRGQVDRVIVGADRIASNGDVANKIGTYGLAVLARAHEIPFVVAAPLSTVDFRTSDGSAIPIEERRPEEVTHLAGVRVAPEGMPALNPAFDITPHHLVTAIVTDAGIAYPPYQRSLADFARSPVGGARDRS